MKKRLTGLLVPVLLLGVTATTVFAAGHRQTCIDPDCGICPAHTCVNASADDQFTHRHHSRGHSHGCHGG